MRAFVHMRQMILNYDELLKRIIELEENTDIQFNEIYQALTELASKKELGERLCRQCGRQSKKRLHRYPFTL